MRNRFFARFPGGSVWRRLWRAAAYARTGDPIARRAFRQMRRVYLLGWHFRTPGHWAEIECPAQAQEVFYHFTSKACVEEILRQGILPRDGVVFLSDRRDDEFIRRFFAWRDRRGAEERAVICVDGAKLSTYGRVWKLTKPNEYAAGFVPPDCILCAEELTQENEGE